MKKFLIIICTVFTCLEAACPEWDKHSPCSCIDTKIGTNVQCSGASDNDNALLALSELQPTTGLELQLDSMNIDELPSAVASVYSLRIRNSYVRRLQKSRTALWPNLSEVVFESVTFEESMWPQLKGARSLKFVKVSDVVIKSLDQEMSRSLPISVEYIELRKTSTTEIKPFALSHLSNLRYIFITDVPLATFPRNSLPPVMHQLHTFVLGNTQIENLEAEFFHGMPQLEVLMLNGNRFSTLELNLFMPLQSHLNYLLAERNLLQCNCDLLWLKKFQKKRSINIFATCYNAHAEQIKEIIDLQEEEYCS